MIRQVSFFQINRLYRQHGPAFVGHLWQQYGDLFYAHLPLMPRLYFVLDPTEVYDLLVKQKPMLEKPGLMRRFLQSSFGDGLFTSRGDLWRQQRKLMQPTFHHTQINRYAGQIVRHTEAMLAGWQEGDVVAIDEAMHALTFTIIVDALFSARVSGETTTVHQAIHDLGQGLAAQSQSLFLALLPEWMPWPALRQKRRGAQTLDRLVYEMIAERRALGGSDRPADLLSILLFTRDEETGATMSDRQLRDELVTLYIAGHETTAVLLNWTWVLLSQHSEVAAALQAELDAVLNSRRPTFEDIPHLAFTGAIIKEVLRLYPPAWFLFREAPAGLTMRGEAVPAKSILFMFPYAVHRDGRWYQEPQAFRPGRWLEGLEQSLPKGAYFPFGLGPRTCIGNGFAQMEAQLILATIAQRFRLRQLNEAAMGHTPTLGFAAPVHVRLHRVQRGET